MHGDLQVVRCPGFVYNFSHVPGKCCYSQPVDLSVCLQKSYNACESYETEPVECSPSTSLIGYREGAKTEPTLCGHTCHFWPLPYFFHLALEWTIWCLCRRKAEMEEKNERFCFEQSEDWTHWLDIG